MSKRWAVTAAVLTLVAGGLISPGVASAAPPSGYLVTFSGDPVGVKPDGWSSAGAPKVAFYDTIGAKLFVGRFGEQAHGQALSIDDDDASALEIRLSAATNSISLAFGNDDPTVAHKSDLARLKLYRGTKKVGQVSVKLNANDVMDQTIGTSRVGLFDRATFQYVNAKGNPKHLTEIVDNIAVGPLCTITGTSGSDHLVGTAGRDVICGDSGDDVIRGGSGDDLIYGGPGKDHVTGGKGKDVLDGGSGRDRLSGGPGNDHLTGGSKADHLSGGTGKDHLTGGKGKDHVAGGKGIDHCAGGSGVDHAKSCEIRSSIP
jgi:hypothetical protein